VVEDDESVRVPTARMLRAMGYTVVEATNGSVALAMVTDASAKIDLVVTDMIMPQMGGVQLMEHLHALHPDLKVLFLSGYTQDALTANGTIIPDVHFLQKPFTRGELARAVRQTLGE
jgi:two-component system cell cycle sensor histidine kinase/response regulator CckA